MKAISIDGGGYLGLATATLISEVESELSCRFTEEFSLFCGTSTGAIIAAALAYGKTGKEIQQLYKQLGPAIFPEPTNWATRTFRNCIKPYFSAKWDNNELIHFLNEQFGETTLGDIKAEDRYVVITAFNVSTGYPRIFKTDHSSNLGTDDCLRLADVTLASVAAPTYFPVVEITNQSTGLTERFCDGGVVANHPALLGLLELLYEFETSTEDARILSLATPNEDISEADSTKTLDRGILAWKDTWADIFISSGTDLNDEIIRRITKILGDRVTYRRINLDNPNQVKMDNVSELTTKYLQEIGSAAAADVTVKNAIKSIIQ